VAPSSVCPPGSSGRNCFGRFRRLAGHKRVPPPPAMINAYVFFDTRASYHILR
jgi:hypothetical protein